MTDPATQLAFLRTQRDAAPDAATRAMFESLIATLESQQPSAHTQAISGEAQLGAAVAGDVRGGLVAPLLRDGASNNVIANIVTIVQQSAPPADYNAMLRTYLRYLYSHYERISLRGIGDDSLDLPLRDLYLSLTLREPPAEAARGPEIWRKLTKIVKQAIEREDDPDARFRAAPQEWSAVLGAYRQIMILGNPGSGKSTLLQYTALRLVEALATGDAQHLADLGMAGEVAPPVPLLLPLRQMSQFLKGRSSDDLVGDGASLILRCLTIKYQNECLASLTTEFFTRLCEEGRAILLLDGLDEVSSTQERELVSTSVRSLVRRFGACRFIVTSRIPAYEGAVRLGGTFREFTIADLDDEQQQRFIANWSGCVFRHKYPRDTPDLLAQHTDRFNRALWQAMEANDRINKLRDNPLLLTIIAVVYYAREDLPENRAALYDECVRVFLRGGRDKTDFAAQERARYSGVPDVRLGTEDRRDLLAYLAYSMHSGHSGGADRKYLPVDELERLVAEYMQIRLADPSKARAFAYQFRSEALKHIGLIDELEMRRYGFLHLSFQEYLAALHIAAIDELWPPLLDWFSESWWREVILLCAGVLPAERCWKFLGQLIERGNTPEERAATLELAAAALAELERFKGQGPIRATIQARALELFQQPAAAVPAAARVVCGRVLARLGDPRDGVCTLPPDMVRITGGTFTIGSTRREALQAGQALEAYYSRFDKSLAKQARKWPEDEINEASLTLPTFEIARFLVTNAQFAFFRDDDGYNPEQPWWEDADQNWLHSTMVSEQSKDQIGGLANHPVVNVSWYEAMAFCRWLSQSKQYNPSGYTYTLPSEAEWEYAARGQERRTYPWGDNAPDNERANFGGQYGGTSAVGSFPRGATPEGVLDMTGNALEWTRSEFQPYPYDPADGREDLDGFAQKRFTLCGGSWGIRSLFLRASHRGDYTPDYRDVNVGFRLARHLKM